MYIKEIHIAGFRSYKDITSIKDFSPKHNVVVGRNGSGKSNFFTAIQFVLSSDVSYASQQQRHGFLHESVGSRANSARVEIIFDNTHHRIPIDNAQVSIARQLGMKNDQYFIDGKVVTKNEIINLMESAGFSRSNPYYIVKQGKITELATASDQQRLKLIKEVAGTRVFDEKKEESTKILTETQGKIEKSITLLGYINERLKKLEEEKEDLAEYQKWDKMKRSIEYTIFDKEINQTKIKLEKLTSEREKINKNQNDLETNMIKIKTELIEKEKQLRELNNHYKGVLEEKESYVNEQEEQTKRKTELELLNEDLQEDVNKERKTKEKALEEKAQLEHAIQDRKAQLNQLKPRYNDLLKEENSQESQIRMLDQRCKELYAKQGYNSKEERDKHLNGELDWIKGQTEQMNKQIKEIEYSIEEDEKEKNDLSNNLQKEKNLLEDLTIKMAKLSKENKQNKEKYAKFITIKMDDTHKEKELNEKLTIYSDDINQLNEEYRRIVPKAIINGISSIEKVLDEYRKNENFPQIVNGYHGRVIDLFKCNQEYYKAIEVTAGSRLFYHVVENDDVAMALLKRINQLSLPGEVNFYPLNRIVVPSDRHIIDQGAIPILQKLYFEQKYSKLFKVLFDRCVLVHSLVDASRIIQNEGLNCVTLEGDQQNYKGPMTGGYIDTKRSKIDCVRKLKNVENYKNNLKNDIDILTEKISKTLQEIDEIRLNITKYEADIQRLNNDYNTCLAKKQLISDLLNKLNQNSEPKKLQLTKLETRINELVAQKESISTQMKEELRPGLSEKEKGQINQMEDDIKNKKVALEEIHKERVNLENNIETIKNELQHRLIKKKDDLEAKIDTYSAGEKSNRLDTQQADIKLINERLAKLIDLIGGFDESIENYNNKKLELNNSLDQLYEQQKNNENELEELSKNAEIYCTKIANIQAKREENSRKIKEIGTLPSDAHEKYKNCNLKELDKKLQESMNHLKKYENVNKKAFDQFMLASQQKDELTRRVNELQKNEQAIKDLLTVLENRRYQTLFLTFKQVSKYFHEVFRKLIPNGTANLVMKTEEKDLSTRGSTTIAGETTTTDGGGSTFMSDTTGYLDEEMPERQLHELQTFVGTSIRVSFTGTVETRDITSLSGGQKTLVALALIFAIQKCDPAPFYLFDEIDAALDQEHRRAIADMINELSKGAQFITTTFRPELLEHAEKFYGVRVRDKVSYIDEITKERAIDFVQDDQAHT